MFAGDAELSQTMSYDDRYDDEYDDYDDIDDEYPDPGAPGGYVGDAETLLRRAIDIIATAPTMPLSSSPRIDRDEIIELLEEALHRLPDELRQARWMLKERQEFVAKTRREADELLEAARVQAERMVQRTEVVRAAEQRARQIMEAAETDSRRLKHETEDFLDQRLGSFEILLDKLQQDRAAPAVSGCRSAPTLDVPSVERGRRPDQGLLRPGPLTLGDAPMADLLRPLRVNAVELLRQPGAVAPVEVVGRRPDRSMPSTTRLGGDDRRRSAAREPSTTASSSHGTVTAAWSTVCRRCLRRRLGRARSASRSTSSTRSTRRDPDAFVDRGRPARPAPARARDRAARARPERRCAGRLRRAVPEVRRRSQRRPATAAPRSPTIAGPRSRARSRAELTERAPRR